MNANFWKSETRRGGSVWRCIKAGLGFNRKNGCFGLRCNRNQKTSCRKKRIHTNEIRRGRLKRGKRSVKMDGVVQSHVVLLVVDGIMMLISVILITTDQKGLRPERQIQEKEIILSYSFKQRK